jgi:hypothetical protein
MAKKWSPCAAACDANERRDIPSAIVILGAEIAEFDLLLEVPGKTDHGTFVATPSAANPSL